MQRWNWSSSKTVCCLMMLKNIVFVMVVVKHFISTVQGFLKSQLFLVCSLDINNLKTGCKQWVSLKWCQLLCCFLIYNDKKYTRKLLNICSGWVLSSKIQKESGAERQDSRSFTTLISASIPSFLPLCNISVNKPNSSGPCSLAVSSVLTVRNPFL